LLAPADRNVIVELVQRFVKANLVLNREATLRAQQDAREAVLTIEQSFECGQTVVRDGQIVGPVELKPSKPRLRVNELTGAPSAPRRCCRSR
jgi:hypothetical protein